MSTPWPKLVLIFVLLVTGRIGLAADNKHDLPRLERSFWLHASLAPTAQKGYWGPAFPASKSPTEPDIQNAAKLLTSTHAANRLYLVYHSEIPLDDAVQVFGWWRRHCPQTVTLVPTQVGPADRPATKRQGDHHGGDVRIVGQAQRRQWVQSQMVSRRDLCNGFSAHGLGQIGC
jgi:hypothetical protein